MKLSQYAKREGIGYRAAWNRYRAGKIPGAYLAETGHIVVPEPESVLVPKAAVYCRVSSQKQKHDLDRQAERMVQYANAQGLSVVQVVKEIASGVDDTRPELSALLTEHYSDWGTLVVEHRDRLTRVGFHWFAVTLERDGKRVSVANDAEERTDDLREDVASLLYSCAARMYGPRRARARADVAVRALEAGLDG